VEVVTMTGIALAVIPRLDPLPLPAPPGLLWFLLMLTYFLHVLPMNFVLGGSVIALVSRFVGGDAARAARHRELVRWFATAMPVGIAATVSFGVAPLLFVQALYGRLFFTGSVIMAWFWFAVIPLLLVGYAGSYLLAFRSESLGRGTRVVAWISTLCFALIAFLYTNNMTLMLRPDFFQAKYLHSGAGLQLNLDDPTLWPRYLHFLMSAIAVAGMALAHYGLARARRDAEFGAWAVRHGALWFVVATVASMGAGIWWLGALPRHTLGRFMGGSPFAASALGLGIAFGLITLVLMAMAITAADPRKPLRASGGALALTLVSMILARDQVRRGALEAAGFQMNPWVAPQWGPILLFALLLVAAIALIVWMVAAFARGRGREAVRPH
jgi:hypothetical protein